MARPWLGHGSAMAEPWLGHGSATARPWLDHGSAMAQPWLGYGQAEAQSLPLHVCLSQSHGVCVFSPQVDRVLRQPALVLGCMRWHLENFTQRCLFHIRPTETMRLGYHGNCSEFESIEGLPNREGAKPEKIGGGRSGGPRRNSGWGSAGCPVLSGDLCTEAATLLPF